MSFIEHKQKLLLRHTHSEQPIEPTEIPDKCLTFTVDPTISNSLSLPLYNNNSYYQINNNEPVQLQSTNEIDLSEFTENVEISIYANSQKIPNNYFSGITNLINIQCEPTIIETGTKCFLDCTGLQSFIGQNVKIINSYCFSGCTNLNNVVCDDIVELHTYSFYNCSNITLLEFTVKTIGSYCFYGCTNLIGITLSNSITIIPQYCFYNCINLPNIQLPNNCITIDNYAFFNCSSITEINLDGIVNLYAHCFDGCEGLTYVDLPNSLAHVDNNAFSNCGTLDYVYIPNKSIGTGWHYSYNSNTKDSMFYNTVIGEVQFAEGITILKNGLLAETTILQTMIFPSTLKVIDEYYFKWCNLEGVEFNEGLITIKGDAFYECVMNQKTLSLPKSLEVIGSRAFAVNYDSAAPSRGAWLQELTIPENSNLCRLGMGCFYSQTLSHISFKNCINPVYIDDNAFWNNPFYIEGVEETIDLTNVKQIASGAFYNKAWSVDNGPQSLTIPESVTSLGTETFAGRQFGNNLYINAFTSYIPTSTFGYGDSINTRPSFNEVYVGKNIQSIGNLAFCASSINTLYLTNSIRSIADRAFVGRVYTIIYDGTVAEWYLISIPESAFSYESLSKIIYYRPRIVCTDGTINYTEEI